MMLSIASPPFEAVDPNLQARACEVLHWYYRSMTHCELRRVVEETTADGMPRITTEKLGTVEWDIDTNLNYIWVEMGTSQPARLLHPRWFMRTAQEDLLTHLRKIGRL